MEVTVADHIHPKDELHHMLGVAWRPLALEEPLVVMESVLPTTPRLINMEFLLLVGVLISEINSMVGSSDSGH